MIGDNALNFSGKDFCGVLTKDRRVDVTVSLEIKAFIFLRIERFIIITFIILFKFYSLIYDLRITCRRSTN